MIDLRAARQAMIDAANAEMCRDKRAALDAYERVHPVGHACISAEERMSSLKTMLGQRFGRFVVLERDKRHPAGSPVYWICRCDCGTTVSTMGRHLRSGKSTSCGCRQAKHRMRKFPEYGVWTRLRARCRNPKHRQYQHYGGRGIAVCERWNSFENFYADMGPRPSPNHSIDRIDNDGPYSPDNCRWATPTQQTRNRRNTVILTLNGESKALIEWSNQLGIPRITLASRLRKGWTVEKALGTPGTADRCREAHRELCARLADVNAAYQAAIPRMS